MKHTPGPWGVLPITNTACFVETNSTDDNGLRTVIAETYQTPGDEGMANATLLAAAPDLLAALRKARVAVAMHSPDPTEPLEEIDAALAKAEGRS